MRLSIAASLAICLASAQAFKNTSPFFLWSNSELDIEAQPEQLQSNDDITSSALQALSSCPSRYYVLISQENVKVEDFTNPRAVPFMRQAMKSDGKLVLNVAEVVGQSSTDAIQKFLQNHCGASLHIYDNVETSGERAGIIEQTSFKEMGKESSTIIRINLPSLPSVELQRSTLLAQHDAYLYTIIQQLQQESTTTVIYTTTPISSETQITYEPTFQEPLNVELKRRTDFMPRAEAGKNATSAPLFEKYQFLSPGIFMGLITVIILLAILSVGISAISSLQVSYGAFDKEMGPAVNKKQ